MLYYFPSEIYQIKEKPSFPVKKIYESSLKVLSELIDVSTAVFLPTGEQITPPYNLNNFCWELAKSLPKSRFSTACIKCHKEALEKVLKTKKTCRFTCKFGLEIAAAPILVKDNLKAILVLGQVVLLPFEKKYLKEIKKLPISYERLKKLYLKIPVLSDKKFTKLSDKLSEFLLNLTSYCIGLTNLGFYEKTKDIQKFKTEVQTYFIQIGKALGSALDLNELLKLIVEAGAKLVQASASSIYLFKDKDTIINATYGLKTDVVKEKKIRAKKSFKTKNETLISREDFNFSLKPDSDIAGCVKEFKTYLGMPLLIKDETKAILNLYTKTHKDFSPEEIEALSVFAHQAALAIDNAQVFERERIQSQEATNLYKAARTIGQSLDLKEVVSCSCQQAAKIAGVDRCLLMLIDEKKSKINISATFGLSKDQEEFFSMLNVSLNEFEGKLFDTIKQGRPLVLKTAPKGCSIIQRLFNILPTSSCLIAPIFTEENLVGLLYLDDSKISHHFTDSETKLVMTLAVQIATAIQRAKLVYQLEENFNQLRNLYHVSTAVSGTLHLSKVFILVTEKAFQLMPKYCWWLLAFNPIDKSFTPVSSKNVPIEFLDSEFISQIVKLIGTSKRKPVIFYNDISPRSVLSQKLTQIDKGGLLALPIVIKKEIVGVLGCLADKNSQFSLQEVGLLQSFSTHSAAAIEKAKLYDVIRNKVHELATVFQVGKAITSTLNFDKVLEAITDNILKAMKADALSIMLLEASTQELSIISARGLSESNLSQKIKVGEGIAGIAVKTGRPMMLIDSEKGSTLLKFPKSVRQDGLMTILSVPLKSKGEIIGLLNIYLKQIYYHSQSEINLLTILANQAAIAIENARLYSEQLEIARIVQTSLVPQKELVFPQAQICAKYVPTSELSGDYYDFTPLSKKAFSIMISDVSGKGTPAAIYTARGKYILKALAAADYPPREILIKTNQIIYSETEPEKFISVFFVRVDLETGQIIHTDAGHFPAVLYKAAEKKVLLLKTDGILIGVEEKVEYHQKKAEISNGDILALYTDGITEARSKKGEFFGLDRLIEIIKDNAELHPEKIADKIYNEVYKFTLKNLKDDFTLLIVKIAQEE